MSCEQRCSRLTARCPKQKNRHEKSWRFFFELRTQNIELRTQNIELRTLAISSEGATDNRQVWSTQCGMPVASNEPRAVSKSSHSSHPIAKKFKSLSSKANSQKILTSILNKIHKIVKNEKMR